MKESPPAGSHIRWPACAVLALGVLCAGAGLSTVWAVSMRLVLKHAAGADPYRSLVMPLPHPLAFGVACVIVAGSIALAMRCVPRRVHAEMPVRLGAAMLPAVLPTLVFAVLPRVVEGNSAAGPIAYTVGLPLLFLAACPWPLSILLRYGAHSEGLRAQRQGRRLWLLFFLLVLIPATWFAQPWRASFYRHEHLGGDEPRYLLMTHSLAKDYDFNLYNNLMERHRYRYIVAGDPRTDPGDAFYAERARKRGATGVHAKPDYWRNRRYGIERLGLPLALAPAYKAGLNISKRQRYGVVIMLCVILTFTMANVYLLGMRVTKNDGASLLAAVTAGLSGPLLFFGVSAYPDALGAALIIFCVRKIVDFVDEREIAGGRGGTWEHIGFGLGLAYLPWVHEKMLPFTCFLAVLYVWKARPGTVRLLCVLGLAAISVMLQMRYYWLLYGQVYPRYVHAEGFRLSVLLKQGLWGLLFDRRRGVLPVAPWFWGGALGLGIWVCRKPRLAGWWVLMTVGFIVVTGAFEGWSGGACPQPRYVTNIMPLFAVGLAVAWHNRRQPGFRALLLLLAGLGIAQGVTGIIVPEKMDKHTTALLGGLFPDVFRMALPDRVSIACWVGFMLLPVLGLVAARRRILAVTLAAVFGLGVLCSARGSARVSAPRWLIVGNQPLLGSLLVDNRSESTFNRRIKVTRWMKKFSPDFDAGGDLRFVSEREDGEVRRGTVLAAGDASGSRFVRWSGTADELTYLVGGPHKTLFDGRYVARFRLRRGAGSTDGEVRLVVMHSLHGEIVAERQIRLSMIDTQWQWYEAPYRLEFPRRRVNFAVEVRGTAILDMDCVEVEYCSSK